MARAKAFIFSRQINLVQEQVPVVINALKCGRRSLLKMDNCQMQEMV